MPRPIELLSPARNLECAIEAIRHGADAVYIGAPRFGARAAAGNSVEDIARLVDYAKPFGVRIYVTLNTLLRDNELPAAQALINDLAAIPVDALIVQDPRILPIPSVTVPPAFPADNLSPSSSPSFPSAAKPTTPSGGTGPTFPAAVPTTPSGSTAPTFDAAVPAAFPAGCILSPLPLHSSTQMDNRSVADVRTRLNAGYQQTVLARELSLDEIRAIHTAVPAMPLEVFIHGALCVSYSGRCYASEYCFHRSANRGECAQFCRLPFDLLDAEGQVVSLPNLPVTKSSHSATISSHTATTPSHTATVPSALAEGQPLRQRHLLSLRDMNRAADLEALMDAGVTSFKIEGRLKDVSYVKNITAYYRQRIDAIIHRRPADFCRSSRGLSTISFTPTPLKSFNRGFTDYFLHTGTSAATPSSQPLHQHLTPKSLGEPLGTVKEITSSNTPAMRVRRGFPAAKNSFTLAPASNISHSSDTDTAINTATNSPIPKSAAAHFSAKDVAPPINNGDGLCFFDPYGQLQGFRINRVDEQGRLYPAEPSILISLRPGTPVFRNLDAAFERQLSHPTAERRIPVKWLLEDNTTLPSSPNQPTTAAVPSASAEGFLLTLSSQEATVSRFFPHPLEPARTPQADNLRRQLLRLGDTPFSTTEADITLHLSTNWFLPASTLAEWRREMVEALLIQLTNKKTQTHPLTPPYKGGEQNESDCQFSSHQSRVNEPNDQLSSHQSSENESTPPLMTCRYCLRQALGFCTKSPASQKLPWKEPLSLRLADGRRFPLRFDCKNCLMLVLTPNT